MSSVLHMQSKKCAAATDHFYKKNIKQLGHSTFIHLVVSTIERFHCINLSTPWSDADDSSRLGFTGVQDQLGSREQIVRHEIRNEVVALL